MPVTLEALGIDRMNLEDRMALVEAILDSIVNETKRQPLSDSLRQELDRRWADHKANPDDVVPWEQVKAEALARMKK